MLRASAPLSAETASSLELSPAILETAPLRDACHAGSSRDLLARASRRFAGLLLLLPRHPTILLLLPRDQTRPRLLRPPQFPMLPLPPEAPPRCLRWAMQTSTPTMSSSLCRPVKPLPLSTPLRCRASSKPRSPRVPSLLSIAHREIRQI